MGVLGVLLSPVLVLFGLETVTHGQISPGGGFQGGVILASALMVVYLVTDYATVERFEPGALLELSEGAGAGGYVLVGVVALAVGSVFLTNVIPLGQPGNFISAGTIPILTRSPGKSSVSLLWPDSAPSPCGDTASRTCQASGLRRIRSHRARTHALFEDTGATLQPNGRRDAVELAEPESGPMGPCRSP